MDIHRFIQTKEILDPEDARNNMGITVPANVDAVLVFNFNYYIFRYNRGTSDKPNYTYSVEIGDASVMGGKGAVHCSESLYELEQLLYDNYGKPLVEEKSKYFDFRTVYSEEYLDEMDKRNPGYKEQNYHMKYDDTEKVFTMREAYEIFKSGQGSILGPDEPKETYYDFDAHIATR